MNAINFSHFSAYNLPLLTFTFLILHFSPQKLFAQNTQPNIVVILADDMGYSDLGCTGSEIATPTLDSLADNGVLFTHCYNTARCTPTRGSLLTGLSGQQAGVGHLNADWEYSSYQGKLADNAVTIAELLQPAGYRTMQIGKWHLGDNKPYWPSKRGFERSYCIPEGGGVYFWPPHSSAGKRNVYLNDTLQNPTGDDWYSTEAFTDYAITFTEEAVNDAKPFFMYLAYIAPHFPLQAWPEDIDKYRNKYLDGFGTIRQNRFEKQKELQIIDQSTALAPAQHKDWSDIDDKDYLDLKMAIYAAQIDNMDQNINRLVKRLDDLNILDNTIILFVSDNGAASASRNSNTNAVGTQQSFVSIGKNWANVSNTPFRRFKSQVHEGGIISPMIMHWPNGLNNSGSIISEPTHVADFLPTFLELTGISYPQEWNGKPTMELMGESLIPLLDGAPTRADRVFGWEHEGNEAVRIGRWKLVHVNNKPWELYDMDEDPTEINDLASQEPEKLAMLVEEYLQWRVRAHVMEWRKAKNESADYEAESFLLINESNAGITSFTSDPEASGGELVTINATQAGQTSTLRMPVFVPGYYDISFDIVKNSDGGQYMLSLNNEVLVESIDAFDFDYQKCKIFIQHVYMDAHMAELQFAVTGKNNGSSGHVIRFDKVNMSYSRNAMTFSQTEFENMRISSAVFDGDIKRVEANGASDGEFLKLDLNKPNGHCEFEFEVESADRYQLLIQHRAFSSRGSFQTFINNEAVGDTIDQYVDVAPAQFETDTIGFVELQAGINTLRVDPSGKNDASDKFNLTFDRLILIPDVINGKSTVTSPEPFIFPNPAAFEFFINDKNIERIILFNLSSGEMHDFIPDTSKAIDITNYETGTYLIQLFKNGERYQRKMIIGQ